MVEEGRDRRVAVLRDDASGLVVEEAIDHDPVVSCQRAERRRRTVAKRVDIGRAFERRDRARLEPSQDRAAAPGQRGRNRFELGEDVVARSMQRHVEPLRRAVQRLRHDGWTFARTQQRPDVLAKQRGEVGAEPVGRQPRLDRASSRDDRQRCGIRDEEQPMRLDRARPMDRFPVAGGQRVGKDIVGNRRGHMQQPFMIARKWRFSRRTAIALDRPSHSRLTRCPTRV